MAAPPLESQFPNVSIPPVAEETLEPTCQDTREASACRYSPGESLQQPKASEKWDLLESLPQETLSVPLGQAEVSAVALARHMYDRVGREDVVLTAGLAGVHHAQVVGSAGKPQVWLQLLWSRVRPRAGSWPAELQVYL